MRLNQQKKFGILYLAVGLVLFAVQFFADTKVDRSFSEGLLSGMSACFLTMGIVRLLRYRRIRRDPDAAADYEAACTDERTAYVANKARAMTFYIFIFVELIGGLLAIYVFRQRLVGIVLCYLTSLQCLTYVILYRIYGKRY